jgi:hypothetical protein
VLPPGSGAGNVDLMSSTRLAATVVVSVAGDHG